MKIRADPTLFSQERLRLLLDRGDVPACRVGARFLVSSAYLKGFFAPHFLIATRPVKGFQVIRGREFALRVSPCATASFPLFHGHCAEPHRGLGSGSICPGTEPLHS